MTEWRWRWMTAAALLLASAVAAGHAVYLYWLPCRGAMLSGTILRGYAYGPDFGDACLRRMDTGMPFPYPGEPVEWAAGAGPLGALAMVLAGLAWLVLTWGSAEAVGTRAIIALPGLLTVGLAVHALLAAESFSYGAILMIGWILVEITAIGAVVDLLGEPSGRSWPPLPLVAAAWGSTAFGGLHQIAEFVAMITFSDANWDVPPGTGYLTTAVLALSAFVTLRYALAGPFPTQRRPAGASSLVGDPT
jgi:hypothetical protein